MEGGYFNKIRREEVKSQRMKGGEGGSELEREGGRELMRGKDEE